MADVITLGDWLVVMAGDSLAVMDDLVGLELDIAQSGPFSLELLEVIERREVMVSEGEYGEKYEVGQFQNKLSDKNSGVEKIFKDGLQEDDCGDQSLYQFLLGAFFCVFEIQAQEILDITEHQYIKAPVGDIFIRFF